MTPEAQRIAIAQACGWRTQPTDNVTTRLINPDGKHVASAVIDGLDLYNFAFWLPDYLNDLNAMHEAEKVLRKKKLFHKYWLALGEFWKGNNTNYSFHATAAQRAEAFLRTLNLYTTE